MRLMLLSSFVGLFLYVGAVLQGPLVTANPSESFATLQVALRTAGASVDKVTLLGLAPVGEGQAAERLKQELAELARTAGRLDSRSISGNGPPRLAISWILQGEEAQDWKQRLDSLQGVLARAGAQLMTVQLEGERPSRMEPERLAAQALDSLRATSRQPWSDNRAASAAGSTLLLPPGIRGVNVQAAARTKADGSGVKVWVAWPALQQEY